MLFVSWQEIVSKHAPTATRNIMSNQGLSFPDLFLERNDAIKFLQEHDLFVLHPGFAVSGVVEPQLEVRDAQR